MRTNGPALKPILFLEIGIFYYFKTLSSFKLHPFSLRGIFCFNLRTRELSPIAYSEILPK